MSKLIIGFRLLSSLRLDFQDEIKCTTPDLNRCSSLVELKMREVYMFPAMQSPVSWSSLKSLSLCNCYLDDDGMANILSGCPVLESIHLDCVFPIDNLNITSPSVKKLTLLNIEYEGVQADSSMTINAPCLQELAIEGSFFIPRCQVLDISSLKKATLSFIYPCDSFIDDETRHLYGVWWNNMVYEILRCFIHVDELIIGTEVLQVRIFSIAFTLQFVRFLFKSQSLVCMSIRD